jgi:hypothetical protein
MLSSLSLLRSEEGDELKFNAITVTSNLNYNSYCTSIKIVD